MIKEIKTGVAIDETELDLRLEKAREELGKKQMEVKEKKLPVLVLFEGWGGSGVGRILNKIIQNMDPRFFKVECMHAPTEEEKRRPFLYRHFIRIPEQGKFAFFDGGWMDEVVNSVLREDLSKEDYYKRIQSIRIFERQLNDNGYLVLKFFLNISKDEKKKRNKKLLKDENTKWLVSDFDIWEAKHYDECLDVYDHYLFDTDQSKAPWYIIDSTNYKIAELEIIETMLNSINIALSNDKVSAQLLQNTFTMNPVIRLSDIDLNKSLTEEEYKTELKNCRKKLRELHNIVYRKKIPVIIAYEGWDAAGKGGNIKRVTSGLDPRGYEVNPIASPTPDELHRHYLWRFWKRLPKTGHFAIFDRTWYGRVMVERLEGLCSENDWQRAYNEMNEFEKELDDWGAVIIKFWVQIDKDTQLERFNDRQNTPEKQWKITDEDWRNRDKWDLYEGAVDEMLEKTNTVFAPWYILESNDKKYARIKAMKIVINEIEKRL